MSVSKEEAEALIETTLNAVNEQYVLPLALALGTLTAAMCLDDEMAHAIGSALKKQADSCRHLLYKLAEFGNHPTTPDAPDQIFEQKRPDQIIKKWGIDLSKHRKRLLPATQDLIQQLLALRIDDEVAKVLAATDADVLAVYYERLQDAGKRLRVEVHLKASYEKPEITWRDLVVMLLLRDTFQ